MREGAVERSRILALYEASGLTVAEYCRREGVSAGVLHYLRRKKRSHLQVGMGRFARVSTGRQVELEVAPGIKLKVGLEDLGAVLKELRCV